MRPSQLQATGKSLIPYGLASVRSADSRGRLSQMSIAQANVPVLAVVYWERSSKSPSGAAKSFQAE